MRAITSMMSQWKAEEGSGVGLHFKNCKGGYFSNAPEYALKLYGEAPAGTKIKAFGKNFLPLPNEVPITESGRFDFEISLPPGKYCYRIQNPDGSITGISYNATCSMVLRDKNDNVVVQNAQIANNPMTVTEELSSRICRGTLWTAANQYSGGFSYIQLMLEYGEKQTAYEPYTLYSEAALPSKLAEGDVWCPTAMKAPSGIVNVTNTANAEMSAVMLIRR